MVLLKFIIQSKKERKKEWWDISESNLIFHFFLYLQKYQSLTDFLAPLNALNSLYWKEKFTSKQTRGLALRCEGTRALPSLRALTQRDLSTAVAPGWLSPSQPWCLPANSVWLLTGYPHTQAQVSRFLGLAIFFLLSYFKEIKNPVLWYSYFALNSVCLCIRVEGFIQILWTLVTSIDWKFLMKDN